MSHPPFAHNPHVYNGVDPDGNETTGLVVHSVTAPVEDSEPAELVGEQGPELVDLPEGQVVAVQDDDADTDVDGDGQTTGYELFTKDDLIAECKTRGLPVTGNKPDLVARLQESDKAAADKPADGGE